MLVIGRSYWVVPIQDEDVNTEAGMKLTEETTEKSSVTGATTDEAIASVTGITTDEAIALEETDAEEVEITGKTKAGAATIETGKQ